MASLHPARMFRYISLTLVAALSYAEIDALPDDARGMLQVEVRVGPVADPASYTASVSWGAVRRAEILLVATSDAKKKKKRGKECVCVCVKI